MRQPKKKITFAPGAGYGKLDMEKIKRAAAKKKATKKHKADGYQKADQEPSAVSLVSGVVEVLLEKLNPVLDAIEGRLVDQDAKIAALESGWSGMPSESIVLQGGLDGACDFLNNRIDALRSDLSGELTKEDIRLRGLLSDVCNAVIDLRRQWDEIRPSERVDSLRAEVFKLERRVSELEKRFEFVAYPAWERPGPNKKRFFVSDPDWVVTVTGMPFRVPLQTGGGSEGSGHVSASTS